jgi:hypothetical protein
MGDGRLSDLLLLAVDREATENTNSNKAKAVFASLRSWQSLDVNRDLVDAMICLLLTSST